ncbi:UDP-N-acetylglucosamine 2-epimerase [Priestia flexa]|uniref:UDP-N-acetylglucosamine 2-epimerase n=1 Tax=Priestia flexa TaxID=86664 RepID=UPI0020A0BCC9|nr:UDP-N-acetylglucosamine 2-epimerase [Priestia flexa]MCP1188536.1 UDP-N-acetylglucosamine 2-epimerase [Priestia flexa]
MKKIMFLTGTRADYGKIKSLMKTVHDSDDFDLLIFVTGMHMLSKYGSTWKEIEKDGFTNTYHYINQKINSHMDIALSNTILGLSNYVHEYKPDMIVVHGDRIEALAGAMVGALNNIKVAHIEGGEVSGTIDESIRHAVTKFSHFHFVSNEEAKKRIMQLGEPEDSIFIIGSPDIDIMMSEELPTLAEVQKKYEISFQDYGVVMFHPVTTEVDQLRENVKEVVDALLASNLNYVVIYPNNDEGSSIILNEYERLLNNQCFKIYPSMKFEYFLTLLKYSKFMVGNSSAGVRETGIYGIPAIDIGNRQNGRYNLKDSKNIIHVTENKDEILEAIGKIDQLKSYNQSFGIGNSDQKFFEVINNEQIWGCKIQKSFVDVAY